MSNLVSRRAILLSIPATLILAGVASAGFFMRPMPDVLDLALTKVSQAGLYQATLSPEIMPVTVGQMHAWTVTLQTASGAPTVAAEIAVSGGMPQHGHGLPTAPQVTKDFGDGRYLIEGVKFNMRGWWTFDLDITGAAGPDVVTFNLVL